MAEWVAKGITKDCDKCKEIGDPKSFAKGTKVRMVKDCESCEVFKATPIMANANILDLYDALPLVYDPITGQRMISAYDIAFVFDLYSVPIELRYDYYHRLTYFAKQVAIQQAKKSKRDDEKKKADEEWKKQQ